VAARLLFTALGAAGLIIGSFLEWTRDTVGTDLSLHALYQHSIGRSPNTVMSLGGAAIGLGLLALLGLADVTGWLTRLAGAVALVGLVLVSIQIHQSSDHGLQAGLWLAVAGSVACVAGGLSGGRATGALYED